jgi:hypothetical protein
MPKRLPTIISITGARSKDEALAAMADAWTFMQEEQERRLRSPRVFQHTGRDHLVYWCSGPHDTRRLTIQIRH